MPARKLVLLVVALLIAAGTWMLTRPMMAPSSSSDGAIPAPAKITTEVLVAARDLPSGTLVKESDVKWQTWPVDDATTGFAVKGKNEVSEYVGSVVRLGMRAGEPLLAGRVVRKQEQGFMAAVLSPGMRAMSISMTPVGGVAGFVFPGDHVDVIVTHQVIRKTDSEPQGRRVSETVLTDVRVLALDQKMDDQATEPKIAQTATLEVTPKQAERLALAAGLGTLSLSLRSIANGPEEPQATATEPVSAVAIDEAAQAMGIPVNSTASSLTWDSDVSQVLSKPSNRSGAVQRVQIMRGKETTESLFDLWQ